MAVKMPVKAPPPLPAPINSWTGWYVGANVGGGWGHRDVSFTPNDPIAAQIVPPPQSFTTSGVVGGLQLGYNWRLQPNWLLGFETDFDWSGMSGSSTAAYDFLGIIPFTSTVDEDVKWFGTVRGRLGWLPWNNLLIYGTGGFAYGRVNHTGSLSSPGLAINVIGGPGFSCGSTLNGTTPCFAGSSGNTATGWTAGGGVEYALWQQWSLKLEYLLCEPGEQRTNGNGAECTVPRA